MADKASLVFDDNTEWQLDSIGYVVILSIFGDFVIDRFASGLNTKNPIYASWKPGPNAKFVDAFTSSWNNFMSYAFSPFSMVQKWLQKIVIIKQRV